MPTFAEIRALRPDWDGAYPDDWTRPSKSELDGIAQRFAAQFSAEFIDFQLNECTCTPIGDEAFDGFGWASPDLEPYCNLRVVVEDARVTGVPEDLAPFRCDNGDYYCIDRNGVVVLWDHSSSGVKQDPQYTWPTFCDWLADTFD